MSIFIHCCVCNTNLSRPLLYIYMHILQIMHIMHIKHILHIMHILHIWFNFLPISRYLQKAPVVFPYTNSRGNIMETEKNHSLKHAPNDIAKWGDSVNTSCEGPETGHKDWVKKQGGKTNQGPTVALSMAQHTMRKEASALLC